MSDPTPVDEPFGADPVGPKPISTAITRGGAAPLYRGYAIEELAEHAAFDEVVHLLWLGALPDATELHSFRNRLARSMALPPDVRAWLLDLPKRAHPMDFLGAAIAGLTLHDPDANVLTPSATVSKAVRLTARLGTIVGACQQTRTDRWPIETDPRQGLAWNTLRGLLGVAPTSERARDFEVCLILRADEGLDASAFAARVTAGTRSGLYASVLTALGTLKGPDHRGVDPATVAMLRRIGSAERVDDWLEASRDRGERIAGFAAAPPHGTDPRARILRRIAERLAHEGARPETFRTAARVEAWMAERGDLAASVDFWTACVYDALGIPDDLFTAVLASSRVAGWCAHVMEQYEQGRTVPPPACYAGPTGRHYEPLGQR